MNKALFHYASGVHNAILARQQKQLVLKNGGDYKFWHNSLTFWGQNVTYWRRELRKEMGK